MKTLEAGAKSELVGTTRSPERRALFFSRYLNQQTFAQQLDASGANWFREVNAGKARIWGLEGELLARARDRPAHRRRRLVTSTTTCATTRAAGLLIEGDG